MKKMKKMSEKANQRDGGKSKASPSSGMGSAGKMDDAIGGRKPRK